MASTLLRMPVYCIGSYEKLQDALDTGIFKDELDRIIWCVLTDEEHKNQLAFVDTKKNISIMSADITADLQPIIDKLQEHSTKISALESSVDGIQLIITEHSSSISNLNDSVETLNENVSNVEAKADKALQDLENVYTKDETYSKDEVYNKDEVYTKDDVYTKSDTYTKTEVDNLMGDLIDPETGEKVDVKDYVDSAVESAISVTKI